ncbi:MAG: ion transporter [Verrucomicrobia bacterium]|jgi:voltage-gated sodium channel|nr:ion transporter [Verrucomicrobiota bacterium]
MNTKLNALVHARWFETTILAVILLAGVLTGLETSPALVARYGMLLEALDLAILAVFIVELALKMAAHGRQPWHYFRDGWNVFDFTIVALCCLPMNAQFAAVLRLARALRLLRLVSALPRLQLLVGALLKSLGAMGYVGLLLALMFYIYGVAGVQLFREADAGHFGSLKAALFSLFQVITLDNWSDIYRAAQSSAPVATPIYFISFILLGTMIMLNLFIGIIMNSMSEMHAEIAERDRQSHVNETGAATIEDELLRLEQQIESLKDQATRTRRRLRHKPSHVPEP